MEMLLVNHPLDCPICDQAGECRLQEFATDYGKGYSRFIEDKNVKPKRTVLGPRVVLDDERCILCSRCVRFSQEVAKDDVLGFIDRGSYSTLTCYPGKQLENNYSLNTVDICPVGALTSTDFRFKMRVWFLKRTKSICTESSVGVNSEVWSREGKIYRITPRRNDAVNDTWMSDSGRAMYKQVEAEDRLVKSTSNGAVISTAESHIRFSEILPTGKTAYVGSGHMSVEEQYLFKKLVGKNPGKVFVPKVKQEGDELLISSDARPNMRGACVTGLLKDDAHEDLNELVKMLEAGDIENLVVYQEDITQMGVSEELLKKVNTVYLGTHKNKVSDNACLVIPTLMVYESKGCFINQQGRLQKFDQAIPGPVGVLPDVHMLYRVLCTIEGTGDCVLSLPMLWNEMGAEIATLAGLSYDKLTDEGYLIDQSAYERYEGLEGKTLHYEPGGVSV
jgi:NADH-quinone oxidoreductase subunit G